jgi:chromosome segregation ATPase
VIAVIASAGAAILAWVAKLRWSKEYTTAKDETIRSKDAHIDVLRTELASLRELTPMKIREYFLSMRQQLEEYNESLKRKLALAEQQIGHKDAEIAALTASGTQSNERVRQLTTERDAIRSAVDELRAEVQDLRSSARQAIPQIEPLARSSLFDYGKIQTVTLTVSNLDRVLGQREEAFDLSKYLASYANLYDVTASLGPEILTLALLDTEPPDPKRPSKPAPPSGDAATESQGEGGDT